MPASSGDSELSTTSWTRSSSLRENEVDKSGSSTSSVCADRCRRLSSLVVGGVSVRRGVEGEGGDRETTASAPSFCASSSRAGVSAPRNDSELGCSSTDESLASCDDACSSGEEEEASAGAVRSGLLAPPGAEADRRFSRVRVRREASVVAAVGDTDADAANCA